jgi:hypothetical protein
MGSYSSAEDLAAKVENEGLSYFLLDYDDGLIFIDGEPCPHYISDAISEFRKHHATIETWIESLTQHNQQETA